MNLVRLYDDTLRHRMTVHLNDSFLHVSKHIATCWQYETIKLLFAPVYKMSSCCSKFMKNINPTRLLHICLS